MSFTNQKPRIATEDECNARWGGHPNGAAFRCKLCGYKFQVGDYWRWVHGKTTLNFIVCKECDHGTIDELRERMENSIEESKVKYWWLWLSLEQWEKEASLRG